MPDCDDLRHAFDAAHALAEEHHCPVCALGARFGEGGLNLALADVARAAARAAGALKQAEKRPKLQDALGIAVAYGVLAGMTIEGGES
jgi:hypothetical protein